MNPRFTRQTQSRSMKRCIEGNEYCITQWSRLPSPNTEICWIKTNFERLQKPLMYYLMVLSGKKNIYRVTAISAFCLICITSSFFSLLHWKENIVSLIVFPQSIGKVWHIIGPNLTSVFCKQLYFSTSKYSHIYPSRRGGEKRSALPSGVHLWQTHSWCFIL